MRLCTIVRKYQEIIANNQSLVGGVFRTYRQFSSVVVNETTPVFEADGVC